MQRGIAVVVIAILALLANMYYENVKSYLSHRLANMVSPMAASIINAEKAASGVMEGQVITKSEASSLRTQFARISAEVKNISDLGVVINKLWLPTPG